MYYSSAKNACKLEFTDNLWIPFLSTSVWHCGSLIINFHVYKILVTKWKHGIGPNDIILFNEELEILSTSMIELVNIDESSHKEEILIFITSKGLNMTKQCYRGLGWKLLWIFPFTKKCI